MEEKKEIINEGALVEIKEGILGAVETLIEENQDKIKTAYNKCGELTIDFKVRMSGGGNPLKVETVLSFQLELRVKDSKMQEIFLQQLGLLSES